MSQRGQRADPSHLKYRPVPGSKLREVYIPCDRSYWQWQYCGDITEAGHFRPWLWPECQCWEALQLCGAPLEPDWHEQ
jgi:hypothetical protein